MSNNECVIVKPADPIGQSARSLIEDLCAEMAERYGTPPSPFSSDEVAVPGSVFFIAHLGDKPLGCGALRPLDLQTGEIKRMYVRPEGRRRGLARRLLRELEQRARDLGYRALRLETGIRQPEAQRLYESMGFERIAAFGPYIGNDTSVCFGKALSADLDPAVVVQKQLEAYNKKDLEALMETYAPDAQQFEFPATLLASGADEIRTRFAARFQEPNLHACLLHRIVVGRLVIDYERVTRTFPEGPGSVSLVAMYEVMGGRIATARFQMGSKCLDDSGPL